MCQDSLAMSGHGICWQELQQRQVVDKIAFAFSVAILKMRFEWDDSKARTKRKLPMLRLRSGSNLWTDPFALIAPAPGAS